MRSMWHRLLHLVGLNTGHIVTWSVYQDGNGHPIRQNVLVAFRCSGCGELSGAHFSAPIYHVREEVKRDGE